jgi:peptidyl-prolyl cis-trans isomerase SurA
LATPVKGLDEMNLARFLPIGALALAATIGAGPAWAQTAPPTAPASSPLKVPAAPATAPAPAPMQIDSHVAAMVNDEVISTYDLRQRMLLLIVTSGVQPTEQNLPDIQREAMRSLVDERLQLQEIRRVETKQKIHIQPTEKELDEELTDLAKSNNMKLDQLMRSLQAAGVQPSTMRDQMRVQMAWRRYMSGRFGSNVHIGDDQIKASLQRFYTAAAKPQYLVSEVFIDAARVGGMEQASAGAQQLIAQLKQGAPFAAVARQFSAAPTAANGGDAGWMVSGDIPPTIEQALEPLKPGEVAGPVATSDGVYILLLRDRRAGASATVVDLKQAAVALPADAPADQVAAANASLETLRHEVKGCADFEAKAAKVHGVSAGDTGETDVKELSPEFRDAVDKLGVDQVSAPIRSKVGMHLVAVCARHAGGLAAPSRESIEDRLRGEQISMLAKRFLRDLRNSATIEAK